MRPLISAHRGGEVIAGESAADRYRRAIALGVDYVEFDVRRTRDGVSIIHHDDRTAAGTLICDSVFRDVAAELGGEALTFEELLELVGGRVGLHLDLKEAGFEAEVVRRALDFSPRDRLVVTSEDRIVLAIKKEFPEVRAGLSLGDELVGAAPLAKLRVRLSELFPGRRLERCRADFVAVHRQLAELTVLRYSRRHRFPAWVWTVDDEASIAKFISDTRVTTLITNRPEVALRLRSA